MISHRHKPTSSPVLTGPGTKSLARMDAAGNKRENRTPAFIGAVRIFFCLLAATLAMGPAFAVNSPRPAAYRVDGNNLVITWTNLSTLHPWIVSYCASPGAWLWETEHLYADEGVLTVTKPMDQPARFYRLWPAAP